MKRVYLINLSKRLAVNYTRIYFQKVWSESSFRKPEVFCDKSLIKATCMPKYKKKDFVAFPWVVTSTGSGGFMICVFII